MATGSEKIRLTDRKRRAILDAALAEFDANGFAATSMDRIAATADVSKRTVYNHFESKEVLFEAMRREALDAVEHTVQPYDRSEPLEPQLEFIAREHIAVHSSDAFMKFARVSLSRFVGSPELASASYHQLEQSRLALVAWIKAAFHDGRLRVADPKRAAVQFIGLLNAQMLWPQLIGCQKRPSAAEQKKIVATTVAMFLDHYKA